MWKRKMIRKGILVCVRDNDILIFLTVNSEMSRFIVIDSIFLLFASFILFEERETIYFCNIENWKEITKSRFEIKVEL